MWAAWTESDQVRQWFTPAPYESVDCHIDLQPGGVFRTVTRSPAGDESTVVGCYLEVHPGRRLVWTTMLSGGFRPTLQPALPFTAIITLEPLASGTRYSALVMHTSAEHARDHARDGFHDGWSTALDQLVAMVHTGA